MKKNLYITIVCILAVGFISGCSITFNKTDGGSGKDAAYSVQQTTDGGYIMAGYTESFGAGLSDVWLIKTYSDGIERWNKTFGGSGIDCAYSVQQTSDGGYIIAGSTESYGAGGADAWLIKTDADGNEQWNKTFGDSNDDVAFSVQQTKDGGYILAGQTYSFTAGKLYAWLIKTNADGVEQWNKTFGGSYDDGVFSVRQTKDGGYILAGWTTSFGAGNGDAWLIKTTANGIEQWNKTFGGSDDDDTAWSVQQTKDGGYILAGFTYSIAEDDYDFLLIKTNANGVEQWNKTFGGSGDDYAYSVQQTKDGGYILAGVIDAGNGDAWLIKTNANGVEQWNHIFGGLGDDDVHSVKQTSDGGYILAGWTGSNDAWLIKTDANGIAPYTPTP